MPTKDHLFHRTCSSPVVIVLFLALAGVSTAQVSIRERVEIKPTNIARLPLAVDPFDVTLPPINLADFSLDACGGFMLPFDNIYDDQVFMPRVGGTIGLAFDPHATHSPAMTGPSGYSLFLDTLLIFGMDGHVKYCFSLSFSYGFDQDLYIMDSLACQYMPYYPCPHPDQETWGLYPVARMFFHVDAWEPLRFRYYVHRGIGHWPVGSSHLLKPTIDFYDFLTSYADSYGWALSTDLPPYEYTGSIVFAEEDFHPDDAISAEGIGMVFPMRWVSIDNNAIGALPPRETSSPIVLPDSGMYRIIVRSANSSGQLSLAAPTQQVLFPNVQDAVGDTIAVGPYGEGTPLQVVLNGQSPCVMRTDYAKWDMGYETGNDYYFDDVGITVEYAVQPPDHLELWSTTETVYYGDTVDVDIVPCGSDSLFSRLGRDEDYQFSIDLTDETSRYGQLLYQGESGNNFWGIPSIEGRGTGVQFAANGVEPDSTVDLTFYLTAEFMGGGGGASRVGGNPDTSQKHKIPIVMKTMSTPNTAPLPNGRRISLAAKHPLKKLSKAFMANKGDEQMSKVVVQNKASDKQNSKQQETSLFKWMMYEKKLGKLLASGKVKKSGLKSLTKVSAAISAKNNMTSVDYLENYWTVKEGEHDIRLGETIYYQVREKIFENGSKMLIIEEREVPTYSDDGVIKSDAVWGDNPVSKANGDKLGVYWEKKDPEGNKLPDGLIRLVGRYWTSETTYKVGLTANYDDISEYAQIVVKKPSILGDPTLSPVDRHSVVTDVFGNSLNMDELIIKYAGGNGIPPELIKGQMEQESSFSPQWRYEPFRDAQTKIRGKEFKNNKFVITDDGMGPSFPPPNHSRSAVAPTFYNENRTKISSYVVDDANWFPKYVRRGETENDPDIIIGSEHFTKIWDEEWERTRGNEDIEDPKEVAHNYVRGLITDATKYPGKGFDRLAQTRIVSSYGFTQLLYTMAITDGKFYKETDNRYFPTGTQYMDKTNVSKYPEKLNEQDISMPRYSDRLLRNLNFLFLGRIPQSEWKGKRVRKNDEGEIINAYLFDGFEANWKGSLYFYNSAPGYPDEVWNKAQNYLPHE